MQSSISAPVVLALALSACVSPSSAPDHTAGSQDLVDIARVDVAPRAVHMPSPTLSPELRAQAPASVKVLFVVDEQGRVIDARVQASTNAAFDSLALDTVRAWRFVPAKLDGVALATRVLAPIVFTQP